MTDHGREPRRQLAVSRSTTSACPFWRHQFRVREAKTERWRPGGLRDRAGAGIMSALVVEGDGRTWPRDVNRVGDPLGAGSSITSHRPGEALPGITCAESAGVGAAELDDCEEVRA